MLPNTFTLKGELQDAINGDKGVTQGDVSKNLFAYLKRGSISTINSNASSIGKLT